MTVLAPRILAAAAVPPELERAMYAIYAAHYEASTPERFAADLAAKDYVIVLEEAGRLRGFSTAAHFAFASSTGQVRVLFSGDTVIDPGAWGEQGLARSFARLAGALHARERGTPLYWLLISKGHRTYRYLSVFAERFYPDAKADDAELRRLACEVAADRFGADFDPSTGVIAFAESHGHLKGALADVPERIAARAEGAFFLQKNPGYREGHELVCLTELRPDNLRGVVRGAFLAGMANGLG